MYGWGSARCGEACRQSSQKFHPRVCHRHRMPQLSVRRADTPRYPISDDSGSSGLWHPPHDVRECNPYIPSNRRVSCLRLPTYPSCVVPATHRLQTAQLPDRRWKPWPESPPPRALPNSNGAGCGEWGSPCAIGNGRDSRYPLVDLQGRICRTCWNGLARHPCRKVKVRRDNRTLSIQIDRSSKDSHHRQRSQGQVCCSSYNILSHSPMTGDCHTEHPILVWLETCIYLLMIQWRQSPNRAQVGWADDCRSSHSIEACSWKQECRELRRNRCL